MAGNDLRHAARRHAFNEKLRNMTCAPPPPTTRTTSSPAVVHSIFHISIQENGANSNLLRGTKTFHAKLVTVGPRLVTPCDSACEVTVDLSSRVLTQLSRTSAVTCLKTLNVSSECVCNAAMFQVNVFCNQQGGEGRGSLGF